MSQVTHKGDKPASSPALEHELAWRKRAAKRAPTDADRPPLTTFPGKLAPVIPGQLDLASGGRRESASSGE